MRFALGRVADAEDELEWSWLIEQELLDQLEALEQVVGQLYVPFRPRCE